MEQINKNNLKGLNKNEFKKLYEKAVVGGTTAFTTLFEEFNNVILSVYNNFKEKLYIYDFEDVKQNISETLLKENYKALKDLRTKTPKGFGGYIKTITRNHCKDLLNEHTHQNTIPASGRVDSPNNEYQDYELSLEIHAVNNYDTYTLEKNNKEFYVLLEKIDKKYSLPLDLKYIQNKSSEEICNELNISKKQLYNLTYKAKENIKKSQGFKHKFMDFKNYHKKFENTNRIVS